ncbi:MAG: hypothetical protein Aurels2KO_38530 [Aureliella sp.]
MSTYDLTGKAHRAGLSLIEVVVSTVIVAFVMTAALQTVATAVAIRNQTQELQLGPVLARDLMSEILQLPYTDPDTPNTSIGTESGEGAGQRSGFDDIDDYNGWFSSPSPTKRDGSSLPLGAGWERSVVVQFIDPSSLTPTATDLGLKKITVTATPPSGDATVIEFLRSSLGANQRQLHADHTIVSGATLSIELTSGSTAEYSSSFGRNHAIDE